MELVVKTDDNSDEPPMQHKFAKMLVGAVVGFIASGLAEKMYDNVLKYRQGKTTVELEK